MAIIYAIISFLIFYFGSFVLVTMLMMPFDVSPNFSGIIPLAASTIIAFYLSKKVYDKAKNKK